MCLCIHTAARNTRSEEQRRWWKTKTTLLPPHHTFSNFFFYWVFFFARCGRVPLVSHQSRSPPWRGSVILKKKKHHYHPVLQQQCKILFYRENKRVYGLFSNPPNVYSFNIWTCRCTAGITFDKRLAIIAFQHTSGINIFIMCSLTLHNA